MRIFPFLRGVHVIRAWSALRVMSPDGFPIYDQSRAHPGAFVATCHSGVTLAGGARAALAPTIARGRAARRTRVVLAGALRCSRGCLTSARAEVAVTDRRRAGRRARRRHRRRRAAAGRPPRIPHDARHRRAARAVLPDGRVLRLPRHGRRRRQPAGLPGRRSPGHARRDAASARAAPAGGGDRPLTSSTSRSSAPARPASRRRRWPPARASVSAVRRAAPRPAARSIAPSPRRRATAPILGDDYWHGASLGRAFEAPGRATCTAPPCGRSRARRRQRLARCGIGRRGAHADDGRGARVILATGAQERPFPIPGWTLPGVMTAGAAQILLKTAGVVPAGARCWRAAGRCCGCWRRRRCGPAGDRRASSTPRRAAPRCTRCRTRPTSCCRRTSPRAATLLRERPRQGARRSRRVGRSRPRAPTPRRRPLSRRRSRTRRCPPTMLLLHQGVVPNVNLARAAGCDTRWNDASSASRRCSTRGAAPRCRHRRRRRRRGHRAAPSPPRRAARSPRSPPPARSAASTGPRATAPRSDRCASSRIALRGRAFLDGLYRPPDAFRVPDGATHRLPLRGGDRRRQVAQPRARAARAPTR